MDMRIITKLTEILSAIESEDTELLSFIKVINNLSKQYAVLQSLASATKAEADTTLASLLNEIQARTAADTILHDTEVHDVQVLTDNLNAEILTRTNAIITLTNNLNAFEAEFIAGAGFKLIGGGWAIQFGSTPSMVAASDTTNWYIVRYPLAFIALPFVVATSGAWSMYEGGIGIDQISVPNPYTMIGMSALTNDAVPGYWIAIGEVK
jgi:hypothetical protein